MLGGRQQDARAEQFQVQPGRGGPRHFGQRRIGDVRGPGELRGAHLAGLGLHPVDLVRRHAPEHGGGAVRHRVDDDQVAEALQQVFDKAPRILAGLDHAVDGAEHGGCVGGREGVDDVVEQGNVRVAEQGHGQLIVQAVGAGTGHQLVQHGKGVTDGTAAGADHQREHARGHRHVLLRAEPLEVGQQGLRGHQAEGIVVRARADGPDDLVRLGGGEDELDVFRRLFDDLQQGVEAGGGHHVGLIDDEDLVPVPDGGEGGTFAQVPGIVHTAVAGGVDLDDVEAAGAVAGQLDAAFAAAARSGGGALGTVQAAGEDAGGGGLAAAARPGEQIGVVDAVLLQGRHQRLSDMLLTDHVREGFRTVAAVKGCTHT